MDSMSMELLTMMQSVAANLTGTKPGGAQSEPGEFQKLLEQSRKPADQGAETDASAETKPEGGEDVPQQNGGEQTEQDAAVTRAQAMWAAMAVAPQQVVPAGQAAETPAATPVETPVETMGEAPAEAGVMVQAAGQPAPNGEAARPQAGPQAARTEPTRTEGEPQAAPEAAVPQQRAENPRGAGREADMQIPHQDAHTSVETEGQNQSAGQNQGEMDADPSAGMEQPLFQNVESAPVKVGEAAVPEQNAAEGKSVEKQLSEPLKTALERGETRVELRLTPEHLGSVQIELVHSSDGSLRVVMSAENPHTQTLLEKHAAGLQGLLANEGSQNVQVQVQRQQESQQQTAYDGRNGHGQNPQEQEGNRQRHARRESQDFLQQLRLGLIPLSEAEI